MAKRSYSNEFKASAVERVGEVADSASSRWQAVRIVADEIGVPARTVVSWLDAAKVDEPASRSSRTQGRPVGSDGAVTRERVIKIAQETIAEMGMSASVREIAERCGLTGNALYHYFPTKADLVEAITTRNYDEFFGHLEAAVTSGDSLADDLLAMIDALEDFIEQRPWFPLVLVRTLPGVFRRNSPMPRAAAHLIDVLTDRAIVRGEMQPSDRRRLEGLVNVALMGLSLNGPAARAAAYDGVRWAIEQLRLNSVSAPSSVGRTATSTASRPAVAQTGVSKKRASKSSASKTDVSKTDVPRTTAPKTTASTTTRSKSADG